jgi:hypothetical protein
MSALIYLFSGLALIWYVVSPAYRRRTNARWKATRPHKLIAELGGGLIGLIILFVLLWWAYDSVFD